MKTTPIDTDFIVSDISGRFNHLLKKQDYASLSQCKTLEDFIIKLNHYFPFITEDMTFTVRSLRAKLYDNINKELDEFKDRNIHFLEYLLEYNKIKAFFGALEDSLNNKTGNKTNLDTNKTNLNTNEISELKGLSGCKSLKEAIYLYIKGSNLEKYFNFEDQDDLQKAECMVLKQHHDYYSMLSQKTDMKYFKEIMEVEGDRQIYEVCVNGKMLKDKLRYFASVSSISESQKIKLSKCQDENEIKEMLRKFMCPKADNPLDFIISRQNNIYYEAFKQYNDLSCIYCYFRLKEQEMRNVLWIAECILQECYKSINEYIADE